VKEAASLLSQGEEELVIAAGAALQTGLEALGAASGRLYHEELLNSVFSRFCIGK
jgi:tRNA U34 5-carboxymethylaminomethyl modifying GTPase MnmE/TrmE